MPNWRELERRPGNERQFERFGRPGHRLRAHPDGRPLDPFMEAGSHPDCVEHVWVTLGGTLPQDCRFLALGYPVLAHPESGFIFAQPMGTAYVMWIPEPEHAKAVAAGMAPVMKWGVGRVTDVAEELGEGWLFCRYLDQEPTWLRAAYRAAAKAMPR